MQSAGFSGHTWVARASVLSVLIVALTLFCPPGAAATGTLEGTVHGLGYCNVDASPLEGAMIFVEGEDDFFVMGFAAPDGSFTFEIEESASPVDVMVVMGGYLSVGENGVVIEPKQTVTRNFELALGAPCASVEPEYYEIHLAQGDSEELELTIGNLEGLSSLPWETVTAGDDCENPVAPEWLSVAPTSGDTEPGTSSPVAVTVDSGSLSIGQHLAKLCITSDHVLVPVLEVPVQLTVNSADGAAVLTGIVASAQSCGGEPGPLANALVVVEGAGGVEFATSTDEDGSYLFELDASISPVRLAVTAEPYRPEGIEGLVLEAGSTNTANFDLQLDAPCLEVNPDDFEVSVEMGSGTTGMLAVANVGSQSLSWFIDPLWGGRHSRNDWLKDGVLLFPDLGGWIVALDQETGELIDANFIGFDVGGGVKDQVLLHPDRDRLLMSHQTGHVVHSFALDGTYTGVFAPAGGQDTSVLQTVRGMALHPQTGHLLVISAAGSNAHAIVEFDSAGNHLGNFIENGAGGLSQPNSILIRDSEVLVAANGGNAIHRYTLAGEPDGIFATVSLARQMTEAENDNVLIASASSTDGGVYEFDPAGAPVAHYNVVSGVRGVHELPGGSLLVSNGSGVHEIDRDNHLIQTTYSGSQAQFITRVSTLDCTAPDWLSMDVLDGTIETGGPAQTVTLTFDASALEPGEYMASLCVESNDPTRPLVEVPISMSVYLPASYATVEGTVAGYGYCGTDPLSLGGAMVTIVGNDGVNRVVETDSNGYFETYLPAEHGPLDFMVAAPGYLQADMNGVEIGDGDNLIVDFALTLDAPCMTLDADGFVFDLQFGAAQTQSLTIGNIAGGGGLDWNIEAVQGNFHADPRAHFPDVPYIPKIDINAHLAGEQSAAQDAGGGSSRHSGDVFGSLGVPAYGIAAATFNDYVMLDVLEPGQLTSIHAPRPRTVYAQTFIDYDFSKHYFLSSSPSAGSNMPGNRYGYVDTATGAVIVLGEVSTDGATVTHIWGGLTWDRTTDTVYALSNPDLYTIDFTTGEANLVGTISGAGVPDHPTFITIAMSPDGLLYGIDNLSDTLVAIDKTDASAAVIGSLGINASFAQDMAFDDATGVLYWASFQGSGISNMVTVNVNDGSTTLIGPIDNGAEIVAMSIAVAAGGCNDPHELAWLSVDPASGTVAPGGTASVDIAVDTAGLQAGSYQAFLCITTTDPNVGAVSLPVELEVTDNHAGTLEGTVTGSGYCGGDPQPLPGALVTIHGTSGSFERTTDQHGFYQMLINEGESPLDIVFNADGHAPATLQDIIVEAGNTRSADMDLAPLLGCTSVDAGSMDATLIPGSSTGTTLLIDNSGAADATFEIISRTVAGATRTIEIHRPERPADGDLFAHHSRSGGKTQPVDAARQRVTVPVRGDAVKVLVVSPDAGVSAAPYNLVDDLNVFPDVEASLLSAENLAKVTVRDLIGFDVVVTTNYNRWADVGSDVAIGNALADYVDQGGRVVLHNFALDAVFSPPNHFRMAGRYIEESYAPMTLAAGDTLGSAVMIPLAPGHRIFDNVHSIMYDGGYRNTGHALVGDAQLLAQWSDGVPMLAMNGHSIYLNAMYSRAGEQGYWSGDLNVLTYNAIHELTSAPMEPAEWLSFEPQSGIVSAAGSHEVEVTFSVPPEMISGVYEADIVIIANDGAGDFTIMVEATLTVTDEPEHGVLTVDPHELGFGVVDVGSNSIGTVVVSNSADSGSLLVSGIQIITDPAFELSEGTTCQPAVTKLQPGESCEIAARFTPQTVGEFVADLIVETADGQMGVSILSGGAVQPVEDIFSDRFEND